jgi:phenylalanine-4-hydroxylase
LRFDLRRIMRTRYRIDDFQQLYFVIDTSGAVRGDSLTLRQSREIAALPDLEPTARLDQDRELPPRPKACRAKTASHASARPKLGETLKDVRRDHNR